jgi:serine/threonine protein phosphatase 1
MLKRFKQNTVGRDLIVGDVHGHFGKLQQALEGVGFAPEAGDRLFSVGDLVDRGPESDSVTDWLEKPWFHAVRGNHEQMAIDFAAGRIGSLSLYVGNGGAWNISNPPERIKDIGHALAALPVAIELETAAGLLGIVHADCPVPSWADLRSRLLAKSLDADSDPFVQACVWSRSRIDYRDESGVEDIRAVIVGHTPVQRPVELGNVIYVDTGGWLGREFTILDAATLKPAEQMSRLAWA